MPPSRQAVVVYEILDCTDDPGQFSGVGLCVALFVTELLRACTLSLQWALNLRTAVRLKGALCSVGFQKVVSLRVLGDVSNGEVMTDVFLAYLSQLDVSERQTDLNIRQRWCCYVQLLPYHSGSLQQDAFPDTIPKAFGAPARIKSVTKHVNHYIMEPHYYTT